MLVEMTGHEVSLRDGATGSTVVQRLVLLPRGWLCGQPLGFFVVLLATARHLTESFELSVGASAPAKEQMLEWFCLMKQSGGTIARHNGI
jgi:hypothetical protein